MKTAISVPDDLFRQGEAEARRLKISRSQLYSTALALYFKEAEGAAITAKLNEVYSRNDSKLDPALERAQFESIGVERW